MTSPSRSPQKPFTKRPVRWTTRPAPSRSASARPWCSPSALFVRCVRPSVRAVRVVTAAGSGERLGGKRLRAPIDGEPLLDHTIDALLDGGVAEVIVVVGRDARVELERDVNAMLDPRVRAVENPDPSRGMFSSIQEGVAQAQGDAILVMPGDMPFVSPDTVRAVIAAYEQKPAIISPRYRGKRGHPVALPAALRDEIRAADARATLHDVIHAHTDMRVDVDVLDPGVIRDVDKQQDLEGGPN